jgi:deazaflavin-dependent oxidoreductase (nitroreductase family)
MPAPKWFGRFNRQVTNRCMVHVARHAPGFGVIVHRGRRSGRSYMTPVNIFRRVDGYAITLDRTDSDWLKNVLAAGQCALESHGHSELLTAPRIVHDETFQFVPPLLRPIGRWLGAADYLHLKPPPAPTGGR